MLVDSRDFLLASGAKVVTVKKLPTQQTDKHEIRETQETT